MAASSSTNPTSALLPPKIVDVSIIGGGPAGNMASLCLTTYGFVCAHFDNRTEPTIAGRADGIQPRTMEVLRNIGGVEAFDEPGDVATGRPPFHGGDLTQTMQSQGVRVYEVAFWDPTDSQELARTSRAPSCPANLVDVLDNYTLLLHQGRIERAFLNEIAVRRKRLQNPPPAPEDGLFRPYEVEFCQTLSSDHDDLARTHPVELRVRHVGTNVAHIVRSKYLLGCDGARSIVRRSIAGGTEGDGEYKGKIRMLGEGTDIIWGVMDAQITTDFPDIKYKCLIHSRSEGSIMVIPRENSLVRFYVQLQSADVSEGKTGSHIARDKATQEYCIERAKKIMAPYKVEVGYVDWYSQYAIGQRIASSYSLDQRIFLGGDATHTHSPKAGQGMNISMLDMYSLAWKINLVEKGIGNRDILLPSYEQERRHVAEELLKFDSAYSRLFSGRNPTSEQLTDSEHVAVRKSAVDAQKFIDAFKANARFTSGCGAVYPANELNILPESNLAKQESAFNPSGCTLVAGERLTPAMVLRVDDANQVALQQEVKMNGAFRIVVLAGDLKHTKDRLTAFAGHLETPNSFLMRHQPLPNTRASIVDGYRPDAHLPQPPQGSREINPFFTVLTVVGTHYYEWEISDLPSILARNEVQVYCDCLYDPRVHEAGINAPVHAKYGIDTSKGAIVAVRPDGYVGAVVGLDESGCKALDTYFAGFLVGSRRGKL